MRLLKVLSRETWQKLGISFVVAGIATVMFVKLAHEVVEKETVVFDNQVLNWVEMIRTSQLDLFAIGTTDLGYVWWVSGFTLAIASLCIRYQRYRSAIIVLVGVGGAALLNLLIKVIFQRDRPSVIERLIVENSFSFPSGHAMASAALGLVVMYVMWSTRFRWIAIAISSVYIIYIGFSRVYLGVHFVTDVIAGWTLSIAWVALSVAIIDKVSLKDWNSE